MSKDHIKLDEWDIVKWLTVVSDDYCMERCMEAAEEIKRLRTREALLLEVLEGIMRWNNRLSFCLPPEALPALALARSALGEEKK